MFSQKFTLKLSSTKGQSIFWILDGINGLLEISKTENTPKQLVSN